MTARSYLFVPGDRADMLAKARSRGADAVIADLEDAVAPSRKVAARTTVAAWLDEIEAVPGPEVWVRINPADNSSADLAAVVAPALTGVMVPKLGGVDELRAVSSRLTELEREAGMSPETLRMLPIIETAAATLAVGNIAAVRRVQRLMIGEFDLAADLGIDAADETALLPLRLAVVVASAAAGLDPPLGPVSADFKNLDAVRAHTEALKRRGFGARPAIHPAQVPVINEVFTPSEAEVAAAQHLVQLYDAALADGRGSMVDDDGKMIDEAVVRSARRTLARAARYGT